MRKSRHMPRQFPPGTKYVLERRGRIVRRHIEFPDGQRIELSPRKAATCLCLEAELRWEMNAEEGARVRRRVRPAA